MFEPSLIMRLRSVCLRLSVPALAGIQMGRICFYTSSPHPLFSLWFWYWGEAMLFISSVLYGGNDLLRWGAWRQLWAPLLRFLLPTPPLPLRFYWQTLHSLSLAVVLLTESPLHRLALKIWPLLSFTCDLRDVTQLLQHILLFCYSPHVLLENYSAGLRGRIQMINGKKKEGLSRYLFSKFYFLDCLINLNWTVEEV